MFNCVKHDARDRVYIYTRSCACTALWLLYGMIGELAPANSLAKRVSFVYKNFLYVSCVMESRRKAPASFTFDGRALNFIIYVKSARASIRSANDRKKSSTRRKKKHMCISAFLIFPVKRTSKNYFLHRKNFMS